MLASNGDALHDLANGAWYLGFTCDACCELFPAVHPEWAARIADAVCTLDPETLPPAVGY